MNLDDIANSLFIFDDIDSIHNNKTQKYNLWVFKQVVIKSEPKLCPIMVWE